MGKQWKRCQTLFLGGSKIPEDGDCSHEIKRHLLLGRKAVTNLDNVLKSRDTALPTKVRLVKAVAFSIVSHPYMTTGKTIALTAAAAAKSLQSCLTLCDPTDSSPPGSPVPGILQARTLEWVVMSFSNACK